jgi:hypothetical protein
MEPSPQLQPLLAPGFPLPGAPEEAYLAYVLEHANTALLLHGVCELPVLSPAGCEALCAGTAALLGAASPGIGTMHGWGVSLEPRYTALLHALGAALEPFFHLLYTRGRLLPGASYSAAHATTLQLFSAHAIGYGLGPTLDKALKEHRDASTVTATLCLGRQFTGTALAFRGRSVLAWERLARDQRRLSAAEGEGVAREARMEVTPTVGRVLLHYGNQLHQTMPVSLRVPLAPPRARARPRAHARHTLRYTPPDHFRGEV